MFFWPHTERVSNSLKFAEEYIDKIQEPAQYHGPKIVTIERESKGVNPAKYNELFKELGSPDTASFKIATFLQDAVEGAFCEDFTKFLKENQKFKLVDAGPFFEKVGCIKTLSEQVRNRLKKIRKL